MVDFMFPTIVEFPTFNIASKHNNYNYNYNQEIIKDKP